MDFPERLLAMQALFGSWYLDEYIGSGSYGKVFRIKKTDSFGTDSYAALKWLWVPQNPDNVNEKLAIPLYMCSSYKMTAVLSMFFLFMLIYGNRDVCTVRSSKMYANRENFSVSNDGKKTTSWAFWYLGRHAGPTVVQLPMLAVVACAIL